MLYADTKMGIQDTSVYMWDEKLLLSDPNFEQKLSSHNYDYNAAKGIAFPEDHLLAQFANLAYKNEHFLLPEGWELLTTATNKNKTNGYFGIAVWNSGLHQLVIAHRGTKLSNIGALITDLLLAFNQEKTGQSQSAATFVHLICDAVKRKMSEDGLRLQVSITGHSLGAWLAQITTFTVKYFKRRNNAFVEDENYLLNVHPHTVAFESPGCKEAFVKLVRYFVPHYAQRKYGNYNTLDMTVYLSQLNPINSINEHVGTLYIIRSQTHSMKDIINQFDKDGRIFKERLLDFRSGMVASCKSFFKRLAPCSTTKTLKEFVKENEYSLNVFSERELDFVKDWTHVVNYSFPTVLQFKQKHLLPDFDVDDERNIIKGHTVNTAIACIKHIKPTKTVIYELLQNDKDVRVHYEIFKLKTQQFEKDLLQFRSYYFKDKYCLKEYLKSNDRILHIQVDRNSTLEYELETSVLNSVITYYKNNDSVLAKDYFTECRYGFMAWKKLYEVLHILPDIFENYKVNLVIIECFEMEDQDKEAILQFLKKSTIKLILLSTNEFSWKEGINNIKEVPGFGDNIQFRDLTEECQQEFFMQKNLKLYGKEISFYDIISASFPFNDDVYHHLHKAIPIDVLLELMVTPITEPIEMDCSFNNLLKGAIFLELHHEVNFSKLQKLKQNEHLQFIMQSDDSNLLQTIFEEEEKIDFKIQNDFVSYCLEHFDKISYLFTIKNSKPFLTTIFNKNFYISRNIIKKKTISSFIFEDVSDDFDEYYVCGNESKFKEYLIKENREHFRFVSSEDKAKEKIRNSKAISSHLLKVDDDKIKCLYSRGNMDQLRNYLVSEETFADEMELTDSEDIIILSGEPGIGKSSTIGMQFLYLQKTHWVFAVPLKHTAFDDLNAVIDFDYIAKFILKTSRTAEESCIQHLLAYCLKHETNLDVYLLFDAYDEIHSKDARRKFVELINFLKYSSKVKILITTRKYRCKELENGISVFASHFEIFSSETKAVNFLTNFWECELRLFQDSVNVEDLRHLARNMLQNAEEIFGETISNFIGIPMHLRMIAEVVTPNSSSPEITHMNVLSLYQKYTENRYDIYLKRSGFTCNETMKQWLCEQISTKLYQLAIAKLFDVKIKSIELQDVEELNNIGIIQSNFDTSLNYDFLHDSVRDYFISYLLKRWLELHFELSYNDWDIEKFIIIDIFLNPQYKEMRFFLNCYLQSITIASERLEKCQNRIKQLWEDDPSRFFFDHESAFHVCVKENLCFLMKYFLFQITNHINNVDLLCKRNADLETPLFLALTKVDTYSNANIENSLTTLFEELNQWSRDDIKRTLLTTLCAYFVRNNHLDIITNYSQNCMNIQTIMQEIGPQYVQMQEFLEACKLNNLSKLNSIIEIYQNDKITRDALLLLTNERKETCLHVTTEKDVLDRLLKLGADKNAQDHHGMTPLARAVKEGRTEIAVLLIKKGADATTADYMGNSPLNHAAKYNNLEVAKLLLNSKNTGVDINHPNMFGVTPLMLAAKNGNESIVKYLLDKGANINATDWNGMSPLYHTVKGDCTNLVRILKQKGADINIQDDFEITPLLYSIIKRRWNMVTSLLDNGADVNIGSRREEFPLQLLIKMDRPTIIKKILKDVTVAKDGVMHVVREAAKTNMLSEEQIAYISDLQNTKKAKKL